MANSTAGGLPQGLRCNYLLAVSQEKRNIVRISTLYTTFFSSPHTPSKTRVQAFEVKGIEVPTLGDRRCCYKGPGTDVGRSHGHE